MGKTRLRMRVCDSDDGRSVAVCVLLGNGHGVGVRDGEQAPCAYVWGRPGKFWHRVGLGYARPGTVLVAESMLKRVQEVRLDGVTRVVHGRGRPVRRVHGREASVYVKGEWRVRV